MRLKRLNDLPFNAVKPNYLLSSRHRAEQRLRMCKGCGGLGSKMVSICMIFGREVKILSISVSVPAYLTLTLIQEVDLFMFCVILVSTFKLLPFFYNIQN